MTRSSEPVVQQCARQTARSLQQIACNRRSTLRKHCATRPQSRAVWHANPQTLHDEMPARVSLRDGVPHAGANTAPLPSVL